MEQHQLLFIGLWCASVVSSTGVHVAEMFTTGVSAASHHKFGNINKKLVDTIDTWCFRFHYRSVFAVWCNWWRCDQAIYCCTIGLAVIIIRKQCKNISKENEALRHISHFRWFYGCCGRWRLGSIVTLLGRGRNPRYTIGSVNAAVAVALQVV
jgi:hypothetical protein